MHRSTLPLLLALAALAALPTGAAAGAAHAARTCRAPDPMIRALTITGADCRVAVGVTIDHHNRCAGKSTCSFRSSRRKWRCRTASRRTTCLAGTSPKVTWRS